MKISLESRPICAVEWVSPRQDESGEVANSKVFEAASCWRVVSLSAGGESALSRSECVHLLRVDDMVVYCAEAVPFARSAAELEQVNNHR